MLMSSTNKTDDIQTPILLHKLYLKYSNITETIWKQRAQIVKKYNDGFSSELELA